MNKILEHVVAAILTIIFVGSIFMAVMFGVWKLYLWVMPSIFPNWNENLIRPGFWLFLGAWFLFVWIGKAIFGSGK